MKKFRFPCVFLITLLLTAPFSVFAQDAFRAAGTSTKSYKYIEAQYLFDSGVDNPYILSAYYSIRENIALRFSYFRVGGVVVVGNLPFEAAVERSWFGAIYHKPFDFQDKDSGLARMLSGADWMAGVDIGRQKASARGNGINVSESKTLQRLYLGLRKGLGPKLEVQAALNLVFGNDNSEETIDVVAVYRIGKFLDAAIGVIEIGESDQVGAGLRYTW